MVRTYIVTNRPSDIHRVQREVCGLSCEIDRSSSNTPTISLHTSERASRQRTANKSNLHPPFCPRKTKTPSRESRQLTDCTPNAQSDPSSTTPGRRLQTTLGHHQPSPHRHRTPTDSDQDQDQDTRTAGSALGSIAPPPPQQDEQQQQGRFQPSHHGGNQRQRQRWQQQPRTGVEHATAPRQLTISSLGLGGGGGGRIRSSIDNSSSISSSSRRRR